MYLPYMQMVCIENLNPLYMIQCPLWLETTLERQNMDFPETTKIKRKKKGLSEKEEISKETTLLYPAFFFPFFENLSWPVI